MAQGAKDIGIDYKAFARRAKRLGCFYPNQKGIGVKKHNCRKSKNTFNLDYFDIFTPQMAYWLGFIAADGCITKRNDIYKIFNFTLKEEDKIAVEKLKEELQYTGEVKIFTHYANKKPFNCASLTIFSIPLIEKLAKYDIVPQKSSKDIHYLSYIPEEFKKYFCFGFFDGDGHIGINGERISFLGSERDCKEIVSIFRFEKYNIKLENDKLLYNLQIYSYEDKYKFIQKYIEFSKENWVLPRKLQRALNFENRYKNFLFKRLKNILNKKNK